MIACDQDLEAMYAIEGLANTPLRIIITPSIREVSCSFDSSNVMIEKPCIIEEESEKKPMTSVAVQDYKVNAVNEKPLSLQKNQKCVRKKTRLLRQLCNKSQWLLVANPWVVVTTRER